MKKILSAIKKAFSAVGRFFYAFIRKSKGLFAAFIALVLFLILSLLRLSADFCEFWTRTVGRWLTTALTFVNSLFPVSFYEWFIAGAIIFAITVIVVLIVKAAKKRAKSMLPFLARTLAAVIVFLDFYTITTAFAYDRKELPIIAYSVKTDGALTLGEYSEMCDAMIDEINSLSAKIQRENGTLVSPPRDELISVIREEIRILNNFDGYYTEATGTIKSPVFSRVFAEMGILGVYFGPFGESSVSALTHPMDLPNTIAHELSHEKGILRENEANLSAYYLTIRSDNDYVRYCGLSAVCYHVLNGLVLYNEGYEIYKQKTDSLSEEFKNDYNGKFDYYAQYQLLRNVSNFMTDLYLKLQGQSGGKQSYNDKGADTIVKPDPSDPTGQTTVRVISRYSDIQSLFIEYYRAKN